MNNASILQLLIDQLRILWLYVQRPTVQTQLLALMVTFLITAVFTRILRWVVRRYLVPDVVAYVEAVAEEEIQQAAQEPEDATFINEETGEIEPTSVSTTDKTDVPSAIPQPHFGQLRRWIYAIQPLFFPLTALVLLQILIPLMQALFQPIGLIIAAQFLLVLFLVYSTLEALLYSRLLAKQAHFYDRFLLLPVFLLFTLNIILYNLNVRDLIFGLPLPNPFSLDINIGDGLNFVLIIYFSFIFSRLAQDVLAYFILRRTELNKDMERSVVNLARNLIIGVGILAALGSLGFSLTALTFIAGGLSVGIGTGLSTIAANLVSGFLLWSDDTVRLGDVITINSEMGIVEKMGLRATIVRTFDNVELIVPNEDFMTQVVTAFTKSNRIVRATINVGVGYGSDSEQVRELLLEVARVHEMVNDEPSPIVFFDGFGDSSLDFRLLVWVDDPLLLGRVRSELHHKILASFREANIEIPFPQRDVHLDVSNWPPGLTRPSDDPQLQLADNKPE